MVRNRDNTGNTGIPKTLCCQKRCKCNVKGATIGRSGGFVDIVFKPPESIDGNRSEHDACIDEPL